VGWKHQARHAIFAQVLPSFEHFKSGSTRATGDVNHAGLPRLPLWLKVLAHLFGRW
jgi:hypothetical protein